VTEKTICLGHYCQLERILFLVYLAPQIQTTMSNSLVSLPKNITELLQDFSEISDIKERFEFLLEISEELENFPETLKTEEHKIQGCASNAWIVVSSEKIENSDTSTDSTGSRESSSVSISGTGDALISKGILAFFVQCFEGLSAQEILDIQKNFPEIFVESGVISSLSPSRANGAKAMLEKIYSECATLLQK